MLMRVLGATLVLVTVSMGGELRSISFLDAAEFPQPDRQGPGQQKQTDDDVPQDSKIKSSHKIEKSAMQPADRDENLQQFYCSDQQRNHDRQPGRCNVIENLA